MTTRPETPRPSRGWGAFVLASWPQGDLGARRRAWSSPISRSASSARDRIVAGAGPMLDLAAGPSCSPRSRALSPCSRDFARAVRRRQTGAPIRGRAGGVTGFFKRLSHVPPTGGGRGPGSGALPYRQGRWQWLRLGRARRVTGSDCPATCSSHGGLDAATVGPSPTAVAAGPSAAPPRVCRTARGSTPSGRFGRWPPRPRGLRAIGPHERTEEARSALVGPACENRMVVTRRRPVASRCAAASAPGRSSRAAPSPAGGWGRHGEVGSYDAGRGPRWASEGRPFFLFFFGLVAAPPTRLAGRVAARSARCGIGGLGAGAFKAAKGSASRGGAECGGPGAAAGFAAAAGRHERRPRHAAARRRFAPRGRGASPLPTPSSVVARTRSSKQSR